MNRGWLVTAAHLPSDEDSLAVRNSEVAEVEIHQDQAEAAAEKVLATQELDLRGSWLSWAQRSYCRANLADLVAVRSPC